MCANVIENMPMIENVPDWKKPEQLCKILKFCVDKFPHMNRVGNAVQEPSNIFTFPVNGKISKIIA